MLNDRVTRTSFLISFLGHCLFLGIPGGKILSSFQAERPQEITVRIEIEKPPLLPEIEVMGEEKKLKEVVKEPKQPEPELELQPEEIVMEQPIEEQSKEKIEVIDPAQEVMLRYQDMVKQKIESCRRYPAWAKEQKL